MGIRKLIGAALHPGTSLQHSGEKIVPVDALHALALAPLGGSVLIHARQGQTDLGELRVVVRWVAMQVFAEHGWTVSGRSMNPEQRMTLFVDQVWREYMGEPCRQCRGHGYIGRKFDLVRQKLSPCESCNAAGYQLNSAGLRILCPACRGRALVQVVEQLAAKRLQPCPSCFGAGSAAASLRARARALRFDHKYVARVWSERFRAVLKTLRNMERDALIVIREQLYGPE